MLLRYDLSTFFAEIKRRYLELPKIGWEGLSTRTLWEWVGRTIHSNVLRMGEEDYPVAARGLGEEDYPVVARGLDSEKLLAKGRPARVECDIEVRVPVCPCLFYAQPPRNTAPTKIRKNTMACSFMDFIVSSLN